jgi:hypothetical protein
MGIVPMHRKAILLLCVLLVPVSASAFTVSGTVVDGKSNPVEGATVRFQTRAESVLSGPDGSFTLSDPELSFAVVTAALEGHVIASDIAFDDGQQGLLLRLVPVAPDDPEFRFAHGPPELCASCHSSPPEVTIVEEFGRSRHANAGNNAWVAAALADFRSRNPHASGFCADCHAPGAFDATKQPGAEDLNDPATVDLLALDPNDPARKHGVQCITCHRVSSVSKNVKAINFAGGVTRSLARNPQRVFGPWDDVDAMPAAPLAAFQDSLYCSACHEYDRPAELGRPAVPGQATYSEWVRWQERLPEDSPQKGTASCQHCHMPAVSTSQPQVVSTAGTLRDPAWQPVRRHTFAATWMGPGELLPDGRHSMLEDVASLSLQAVQVAADELEVSVQLGNETAGHKLPTGIDIRNMLVLVEAWDAAGKPLQLVPGRSSVLPYWAGEGSGPEDLAGRAGKGYAKILTASRAEPHEPASQRVEFVEAECEVLDNRIEGALADTSSYVFRLSGDGGPVRVLARAVYRRAWADFTERFGLPRTDALGNPLAEYEMVRERLTFQPAAEPAPLAGTVELDFEVDAEGTPFEGGPAEADEAFAAYGLRLSSLPSGIKDCAVPDGHAYSVPDGPAGRVLAPGTAAAHNECTDGVLRLDFDALAGHVEMTVEADRPGGGFELRALDASGREIAVTRVYDDPGHCETHPVLQSFPLHLDHHGIAALEARGLGAGAAEAEVLWRVRRLEYRFDSAHPLAAGPVATPIPTATPDPGVPTPTPTSTPTLPPDGPVVDGSLGSGTTSVLVRDAFPPGSRVEVRTTEGGKLLVLGAGTSGEDGTAVVRLLRPLRAGEPLTAVNLRTLQEGPITGTPLPGALPSAALVLGALLLVLFGRRRRA